MSGEHTGGEHFFLLMILRFDERRTPGTTVPRSESAPYGPNGGLYYLNDGFGYFLLKLKGVPLGSTMPYTWEGGVFLASKIKTSMIFKE